MSDTSTTTAVIEKVTSKEGAKNGKPWRKFGVCADDTWYSTFDSALGQRAHDLSGQRVDLTWKPSGDQGQFKDLLSIAPSNGSHPIPVEDRQVISNASPNGETDWDLIGLRKTRCLLWAEFLSSPLALWLGQQDSEIPASNTVANFGAAIVAMAEADIYHRSPAGPDEALPF